VDDGPEPDTDHAAELQEKWGTERGQVWAVGDHRLMCGDATDADDVAAVLDGNEIDAVVTDPPYGVGVDYGGFSDTPENVEKLISKIMPFILAAPCAALTPGVPLMWNYPVPVWVGSWVHPAPAGGCPWGFVGNNPILYYGADPYLKRGMGRRPDSIVLASDRQGVDGHPTPKPLAVWRWLAERVTPEKGLIIYDPFIGSGTSMVAAEQLNRRCFGMEIDPGFAAVCLQRMSDMGVKGERIGGTR